MQCRVYLGTRSAIDQKGSYTLLHFSFISPELPSYIILDMCKRITLIRPLVDLLSRYQDVHLSNSIAPLKVPLFLTLSECCTLKSSHSQYSQPASPSGFRYSRADLGFFSYGQEFGLSNKGGGSTKTGA